MNTWKLLQLLCVLAVFCGCTPSTSVNPPPGWVQVDARKFVFYAPLDLKAVPVHGLDSFIGDYKGDSITLSFDYGLYSDPLETAHGGSGYTSHRERIGGQMAKIASFYLPNSDPQFDFAIGVHFPKAAGKEIGLTVFATCKSTNDYETARTIFRTIRFK